MPRPRKSDVSPATVRKRREREKKHLELKFTLFARRLLAQQGRPYIAPPKPNLYDEAFFFLVMEWGLEGHLLLECTPFRVAGVPALAVAFGRTPVSDGCDRILLLTSRESWLLAMEFLVSFAHRSVIRPGWCLSADIREGARQDLLQLVLSGASPPSDWIERFKREVAFDLQADMTRLFPRSTTHSVSSSAQLDENSKVGRPGGTARGATVHDVKEHTSHTTRSINPTAPVCQNTPRENVGA